MTRICSPGKKILIAGVLASLICIFGNCATSEVSAKGTSPKANSQIAATANTVFDFPGFYDIVVSYRAAGFAQGDKLSLQIRFSDIFGKPIPEKLEYGLDPKTAQFSQRFLLPGRAATGRVALVQSSRSGKSGIGKAEFAFAKDQRAENAEPEKAFSWRGAWIWKYDTPNEDSRNPVYFRKTLRLDDAKKVTHARVIMTVDDIGTVFVNGTQIPQGPNYDNWRLSDVYDIKPYLKDGENVVGIRGVDNGGSAGMLAEVGVHLSGGKAIFLKTDQSWKASKDAAEGWAAAGYDDSKWSVPFSWGVPPVQSWGDQVPYVYLGPANEIKVEGLSLASSAQPGETVPFKLTVSVRQQVSSSARLFVEMVSEESKPVAPLLRTAVASSKPGEPVVIQGKFQVPTYFAPGKYGIRLSVTDSKLYPSNEVESVKNDGYTLVQPFSVSEKKGVVKNPVARLKRVNGVPVINIDGKDHVLTNYWATDITRKGLIENCAAAGIHIYWLDITETPMLGPGRYDFSRIDTRVSSLLEKDPEAYILLSVPVDGVDNPGLKGWGEDADICTDSNGSVGVPGYQGTGMVRAPSLTSQNWRDMTVDFMRKFVKHVRSSSYGTRVVGYWPCGGVSYEWQQWASDTAAARPVFVDYSEGARQTFIKWVTAKYPTIAAVNAAWKTSYASFDEIRIPSKEERMKTDLLTFIDPSLSRKEVDFREHYDEAMADTILQLARAVKDETNGESIFGTYYGYLLNVTWPYRYQMIGHHALMKVLNSPDIDCLMSPTDYANREVGGGAGFMTAAATLPLHDKIWLDQPDIRTQNAADPIGKAYTLFDAKSVVQRHFANGLLHGVSLQWYDFSAGWLSGDQRLMQIVAKCMQIEKQMTKIPHATYSPKNSIAVIVDEKAVHYTDISSPIFADAVSRQLVEFQHCGVGTDFYLLDDLQKIPDYKCYVFLSTYRLTEAQRQYIDSHLKRDNKTLVFVYAPGITDGDKLSPARVADVTGIAMEVYSDSKYPLSVTAKRVPGSITELLPKDTVTYGTSNKYGPVFVPQEGKVLGSFDTIPGAGLVCKQFTGPQWTSVYSSAFILPRSIIRGIAEHAGVCVVDGDDSDVTFAADKLVCIHTLNGGMRQLQFPVSSGTVKELFTGKSYALSNGSATVNLTPRSTYLFMY